MKRNRNPAVHQWAEATYRQDHWLLSSVTVGEIRNGLLQLPGGNERTRLELQFEFLLRSRFYDRIVPVTRQIAERWAIFTAWRRSAGRPLSVIDGYVAATAHELGLQVVTRNVKDFQDLGLTIVNPFEFER